MLCVTPYYNKASEDGMVAHYEAIASAVPGDVIVYNVPSRTGCPVTLNVLERLSVIPNISGIKEASGKVSFTKDIIDAFGDRFAVYSGCDEINLQILEAGGAGCVSVLSNILPRTVSEAADAFLRGERERSPVALRFRIRNRVRAVLRGEPDPGQSRSRRHGALQGGIPSAALPPERRKTRDAP